MSRNILILFYSQSGTKYENGKEKGSAEGLEIVFRMAELLKRDGIYICHLKSVYQKGMGRDFLAANVNY